MADAQVTVDGLKEAVKKFCDERDWGKFHTPKELAVGIVTESAELLQMFRFKSDEQVREMLQDQKRREQIGDELADALYFLLRFADVAGLGLSECLSSKLKKDAERYPADKLRGSNRRYDEG
ncbi:nucleotide pyrophosphohydrolase [Tardisphaera miroshnichenkoae]